MSATPSEFACPLCGDTVFETIDFFNLGSSRDGIMSRLWGNRCSTCGHVLLFLTHDRSHPVVEEISLDQLRLEKYN